jgi:hypothetical protein
VGPEVGVSPEVGVGAGFSRPTGSRTHLALAIALLSALVLVAFANSFRAGLIFDNRVVILEDTRVHAVTLENLRLILGRTYWWPLISTSLYRPVTTLSYLLNYAVLGNGENPFGYHLVNLLLHLANVLLVFAIARRLTRSMWLAWSVTAVWAIHPVLTEAVTNVVGRGDLLATLGVLAALWCHIRADETIDGRAQLWWRMGVGVAAVIGVFSKENAVAVAAIIPLWDLLVARQTQRMRDVWRRWVPVVPALLLLLIARGVVLADQPPAIYPFVDNPLVGTSWWRARLTAVALVTSYLKLIVWPTVLSCDYSYPQITTISGTAGDWVRLGLAVAALGGMAVLVRASRALAFACACAFALFLPASNLLFTTGTIMAERLVYLPSLGPIAALIAATVWAGRRARVPAAAGVVVLAVILAALSALTVMRNRAWRDEVTLWTAAVEAAPRSFKAHGALAEALYKADETRANLPAVIAHKEQSLALLRELPDPLLVSDVYGQAATYYLERGDWLRQHEPARGDEARTAYREATKWAARFVSAVEANRPGAQLPSAKQRGEAQLLLSTATLRAEDAAGAVTAARRGRVADPFRAAAYQAEAAALVDARREGDAVVALLTGFMVTGDATLRNAAIDMYRAGLDPAGCAVSESANGPVLNQRCEVVHRHICAASVEAVSVFTAAGRTTLAEQARSTAIQQFGCLP